MSEINHLADAIEQHFTSPKSSSFLHFVVVSDGLTGEQAAHVPAERFNSIWRIANHMAFWMEFTRCALIGEAIDLAAWGMDEVGAGWPPVGEVTDSDWQAARQRALDVCQAFAATIRTLDPATFDQPQEVLWNNTPQQMALAMYGHNCHHTAELLTVRHMQGLWVDHEWA